MVNTLPYTSKPLLLVKIYNSLILRIFIFWAGFPCFSTSKAARKDRFGVLPCPTTYLNTLPPGGLTAVVIVMVTAQIH